MDHGGTLLAGARSVLQAWPEPHNAGLARSPGSLPGMLLGQPN